MINVIEEPSQVASVYSAMRYVVGSNVSADYTEGATFGATTLSNENGKIKIQSIAAIPLLVGDYIKFIFAGGLASLENQICLIVAKPAADTIVINVPFTTTPPSGIPTFKKYLSNYNLNVFVYATNKCIAPNFQLVGKLILKPNFVGGLCQFRIDISTILRDFNNRCNEAIDVIKGQPYDLATSPEIQSCDNSFVNYYIKLSEGYDNPANGLPAYEESVPIDV